jgi:hypothetical protein
VQPARDSLASTADGTHRWRCGPATFVVDSLHGARITEASIGADNILVAADVDPGNFGSTCWTSPQRDWGGPPLPEHDTEPYLVSGSGTELELRGRPAARSGIAITKRFGIDPRRETFFAEYELDNQGIGDGQSQERRSAAPWEISRHPIGGLTFFPRGDGVQAGRSTLRSVEAEGAIWFAYDPASITDHQKLFAHGAEGWVAHVDIARRMLLVKTFPEITVAEQAPDESQIEIYADPTHTYIEVEQQGAYRALEPGECSTWKVAWRLRRLPQALSPVAGSRELLDLVRGLIVDPS